MKKLIGRIYLKNGLIGCKMSGKDRSLVSKRSNFRGFSLARKFRSLMFTLHVTVVLGIESYTCTLRFVIMPCM